MSSTNKTTNYELSQFVETDKPAWLTDYNGDMRKLDTALKAVSDVADGASGGISSLTDRMTAAEGAITTNVNDIDALEARADALEAGAQSTAGTIAGIQTEQTAQNLGIEAATELGYNLARPYDSASTYAVGAYVLFQNTLYKCITAVATGEAFDPTKWLAIKATDEIGNNTIEVIPITSSNFPLPSMSSVKLFDYHFTDNTQTEIITDTKNLRFVDIRKSFYAKVGNLRMLRLTLFGNFTPTYTLQADHSITFNLDIDLPAFIDKPLGNERSYTTYYGYDMNMGPVLYQSKGQIDSINQTNGKLHLCISQFMPGSPRASYPTSIVIADNLTFVYHV